MNSFKDFEIMFLLAIIYYYDIVIRVVKLAVCWLQIPVY
jgi:hypothetical protein